MRGFIRHSGACSNDGQSAFHGIRLRMQEEFANSSHTLTAHLIDYRKSMRRRVSPMTYVEIGTENGGLLLDISEGGLGLQAAHVLPLARPMPVRFRLPRSRRVIEGSAEVVWLGCSQKQAGVRFVKLLDSARATIEEWIANEPAELPDAAENSPDNSSGTESPSGEQESPVPGEQPLAKPFPESSIANPALVPEAAGHPLGTQTVQAVAFDARSEQAEPALPNYRLNDTSLFGVRPETVAPFLASARRGGSSALRTFFWLLALACAFSLGLAIGTGKLIFGGSVGALVELLGWQPLPDPPAPKIPGDVLASLALAPAASSANACAESDSGSDIAADHAAANVEMAPAVATETKPEASESAFGGAPGNTRAQTLSLPDRSNAKRTVPSSVLVRAPGRGAMPLLLSLPEETLLASRDLAITSRRAVEIAPPQDTSLDSKPQRVTVGRLLFNPTPILDGQNGQGDSGSVEILASIGLGGQVLEAKVVGGSGKFAAAAMSAIRAWLYEPTLVDGRPVPSQDDLRFVFGHP